MLVQPCVIHNFGGFYGDAYHFGARAGGLTTSAYNRQAVIAAQTFGPVFWCHGQTAHAQAGHLIVVNALRFKRSCSSQYKSQSFTNEFDKFAALTNISYLFVSFSDMVALSSLALLCFDLLIHKVLLIEWQSLA